MRNTTTNTTTTTTNNDSDCPTSSDPSVTGLLSVQLERDLDQVERALEDQSSPLRSGTMNATTNATTAAATAAAIAATSRISSDTVPSTNTINPHDSYDQYNHEQEHNLVSNNGRAVFESISSALRSIRRRFQQQQQQSNGDPNAANFSERLETVERAHSTRIPLQMLRQPQQPQPQSELEETWPTLTVQHKNTRDGAASTGGTSGSESDGSASYSSSSSSIRRRRENDSILVASRRYAQAMETNDMAVHEDAGMAASAVGVMDDDDDDDDAKGIQQQQHFNDEPMTDVNQNDNQAIDNCQYQQNDITMVLPTASLQRGDSNHWWSSSSSMLSSTRKSFSESVDMEQNAPVMEHIAPPALYSWGPPSPHFDWVEEDTTSPAVLPVVPTQIPIHSRVGRSDIISASLGVSHVAMATASGSLLIWGDNSEGAVDPSTTITSNNNKNKNKCIRKPMHLESVMTMTTRVLQVACGLDHTAIITESRSVLTFGNNLDGQLGHRVNLGNGTNTGTTTIAATTTGSSLDQFRFQPPSALVLPVGKMAAQIACGHRFTLVLTTRMQVYVCGREEISGNNFMLEQQQQQRNTENGAVVPFLAHELSPLQGLPLIQIAAGHEHALVLTAHGTAFAWGNNNHGACGREFPQTLMVPVPFIVPSSDLRPPAMQDGVMVRPLVAAPFFNWAAWDEKSPHQITMAKDVTIVDVACGKDTTILVTQTGQLLAVGLNDQCQLGIENTANDRPFFSTVQKVSHPNPGRSFVSAKAGSSHALILDDLGDVWSMGHGSPLRPILTGKSIGTIAAGGTQSLAIVKATPILMAVDDPSPCRKTSSDLEGLLDKILVEKQRSSVQELVSQTIELFRSPAVLNSVYLDPQEVDDMYKRLLSVTGELKYRQRVVSAIETGIIQGLESIKNARLMYPEAVRCLLLYLQCPLFRAPETESGLLDVQFDVRGETISLLCETILGLTFEGYKALIAWSRSMYAKAFFVPFLVKPLIDQLNNWIAKRRTRAVPVIVGVLRWFQNVAERFPDEVDSKHEDFYCLGIENLSMEALFEDLIRFKRSPKAQRSANFFVCASPFLMSPRCKRNLLQIENQMTMVQAAQVGGVEFDIRRRQFLFNPYFVLAIDRPYMLQQTLRAVAIASPAELRKSLKIVFKGEEGIDAGGVTKEFFQLLVVQLFDINTGMWSTKFGDVFHTWFNADCSWNQDGYYLVGVLVGLAVYNSVILDVHFPQAIYRKLLGLPLGLEDMVDPEVQKGLQALLEYAGDDVEDVFCLTFEVAWNSLGMERKKELKPGGANIPVTSDNKEEYVLLYVKWLLVDSVELQYREFERGFLQVMEGSSLDLLLRPEELELLVVGTPELDFDALQENTVYEGGFDKDSPVVQNLWRFVKQSPLETQLKFLKFSTGTTKAPIGGLGAMPFKIQRAGPDSMQLPTSHTCFNTLLVPDYGADYEKLMDRLSRAIIECEGFGLQ